MHRYDNLFRPSVHPQPTVYFPPSYNYYTPRVGTGPPPTRFYYGQPTANPPHAPAYIQPGIIFQPHQHQHQHPSEHYHSQLLLPPTNHLNS